MHSIVSISTAQLIALFVLLSWAVASDVRSRRVPNVLVLTGIGVALAAHVASGVLAGHWLAGGAWWSPMAGLITGFGLLLPLHLLRAMGAGDVKLLAMVGTFVGPATVVSAFVYTLLAGGLLSLVFMLGKGVAAQTVNNLRYLLTDWGQRAGTGQGMRLAPLAGTAARLPYAVAISLGTAAALAWPLLGR
jgi:prepilin peptidase CpaA